MLLKKGAKQRWVLSHMIAHCDLVPQEKLSELDIYKAAIRQFIRDKAFPGFFFIADVNQILNINGLHAEKLWVDMKKEHRKTFKIDGQSIDLLIQVVMVLEL
jgi:hypothetical protein